MKKTTVYVNPVYPQPERQTGTIWEQATKKKRAKYLIYKYLTLFLVPRPGVEPGWMLLHWCLRPARLPIPPSGQLSSGICFSLIAVQRYEHLSNLPNISLVFSLHTQHFDIFVPSKYIFYER